MFLLFWGEGKKAGPSSPHTKNQTHTDRFQTDKQPNSQAETKKGNIHIQKTQNQTKPNQRSIIIIILVLILFVILHQFHEEANQTFLETRPRWIQEERVRQGAEILPGTLDQHGLAMAEGVKCGFAVVRANTTIAHTAKGQLGMSHVE